MTKILLRHPDTGKERYGVLGLSFTSVLFGGIPLLFRRAWKLFGYWVLFLLAYGVVFSVMTALLGMSEGNMDRANNVTGMGLAVGWGSFINRLHLRDLIKQGYQVYNFGKSSPEDVSKFIGLDVNAVQDTAQVFE
jgi:hypothetical protein